MFVRVHVGSALSFDMPQCDANTIRRHIMFLTKVLLMF